MNQRYFQKTDIVLFFHVELGVLSLEGGVVGSVTSEVFLYRQRKRVSITAGINYLQGWQRERGTY